MKNCFKRIITCCVIATIVTSTCQATNNYSPQNKDSSISTNSQPSGEDYYGEEIRLLSFTLEVNVI